MRIHWQSLLVLIPDRCPQRAVVEAIAPQPSKCSKKVAEIAKKKHKLAQTKEGEVLTNPEVLRRLQEEAKTRLAKTEKVSKKRRKALVDVMNINDQEEQESNEISEDIVAFM